ncbi:hypothetical protein YC2023_079649 [Brassica napus]
MANAEKDYFKSLQVEGSSNSAATSINKRNKSNEREFLNYRRERSGWRKWQILGSYIRDVYNFNRDEVSELVSCKNFFHTSLSGYMVRD